jgi:hypothetical protein
VGNIDASDDNSIFSLDTCFYCSRFVVAPDRSPLLVSTWKKSTTFAQKNRNAIDRRTSFPKPLARKRLRHKTVELLSRTSCSVHGRRLYLLGPVGIPFRSSPLVCLATWNQSTRSLHTHISLETDLLLIRPPLNYRRPRLRLSASHSEIPCSAPTILRQRLGPPYDLDQFNPSVSLHIR